MSLRTRFTLFVILIHGLFVVLSLFLLPENKYVFIGAEIAILISLAISFRLFRAFLKPLEILSAGAESISSRDFSTEFVPTGHRELDQLIDVYNRMVQQLRQERITQREQHYFLERLIHAIPTGVLILDFDGNINTLNPAAENLLGATASELLGQSLGQLLDPLGKRLADLRERETKIISVSGLATYRCRMSHFQDRGFRRNFILLEELTDEVMSSQRRGYETVIRMMSHEVNNTVGAVNSILQSLLEWMPQLPGDEGREYEDAINVAVNRNSGLSTFMTNLASVVRIPLPSLQPYDLHELVHSAQVLLSAEMQRRDIRWNWERDGDGLEIECDVHQMEQVLVNILKNAIEAIDQGGSITVVTSSNPPRLSVRDSGKGISEKVRSQMFTPFFSTKRDGRGVGLMFVREVLVNHGFKFDLLPGKQGGAEFFIELN